MSFLKKQTVTLIPGDGVGDEVTQSACSILKAAGAAIEWEICEAGGVVFKKGLSTGVPQETIDSIKRNKVALKGPLETPVGYGEKSANVTLRKLFETYGNIRPVKEFTGVLTPYQERGVDLVIVRENVEDLYAGIEYAQTPNSAECLKLISCHGCEKIIRLAFEFAIAEGRKKVHCASKANIMKMTEGLLKRTFEEVAKDYPTIQSQHIIVDNCAHQLVKKPEQFDVIVTTNMNGDILSDLSSALVGGLGFAPSANIGDHCAIFEAVHGSAPKHAGQNTINPTAMILSAVMMLRYLKQFEVAAKIDQALRTTLQQGTLTSDVSGGKNACSTTEFTQAVINNLDETAKGVETHKALDLAKVYSKPVVIKERSLKGIDVYIETTQPPQQVGDNLTRLFQGTCWQLESLACRGLTVYPSVDITNVSFIDLLQCRLILKHNDYTSNEVINALQLIGDHYHWMHVEKLQAFDGVEAFSGSHGG
jgi:isocitrate dehydrogenase